MQHRSRPQRLAAVGGAAVGAAAVGAAVGAAGGVAATQRTEQIAIE